MLTFVQTLTNAVYALIGLAVLVGAAALIYFFRGKKVGEIDAKSMIDIERIKAAAKKGDAETLRQEILSRIKRTD